MTFRLGVSGRDVEKLQLGVIQGGYQLCATCGDVLVNGQRCRTQEYVDGIRYWHLNGKICTDIINKQ